MARSLRPNNVNGRYEIRVNASHQGQTASRRSANERTYAAAAAGGISAKLIAILAIAGGPATGAVIAARGGKGTAGGGNGAASPTPTVIVPGLPTVGGPQ